MSTTKRKYSPVRIVFVAHQISTYARVTHFATFRNSDNASQRYFMLFCYFAARLLVDVPICQFTFALVGNVMFDIFLSIYILATRQRLPFRRTLDKDHLNNNEPKCQATSRESTESNEWAYERRERTKIESEKWTKSSRSGDESASQREMKNRQRKWQKTRVAHVEYGEKIIFQQRGKVHRISHTHTWNQRRRTWHKANAEIL